MGEMDLHIDIVGDDSSFSESLRNVREGIKKTRQIIEQSGVSVDQFFKKIRDNEKNLESLNLKIDLSGSMGELEKFDRQIMSMCNNLDKYFEGLKSRLDSMLGMIGDGNAIAANIKTNDENIERVREMQKENAELTAEIQRQRAAYEEQQKQLRELADAVKQNNIPAITKMGQSFDDATKRLKTDEIRNSLNSLKGDMDETAKRMGEAFGRVEAWRAKIDDLWNKMDAGDKTVGMEDIEYAEEKYNNAVNELKRAKEEYNDLTAEQRKYIDELSTIEDRHARMRTQIMDVREELVNMIAAGKQGTPQFQELAEQAGELYSQMALANATMQYFSDPSRNLNTLKVGLQGVAGAAGLVTGVIGLFNSENAKMAEIQAKVQSVLGVIIGLETTYNLVKKNSYVMLALEEVKTWALAKARGVQSAATTAATVAQEGLNTAMRANPIGAIISLLAILGTAIYAVVKALTSETDAERQAREEKEAHIKAIREQHEQWAKSVADSASRQLVSYRELQRKWNDLGDDLNAKKKFVIDNKEAFNNLGFAVNSVSDAESLLVTNTNSVVSAIMARAKAAAYAETMKKIEQQRIQELLRQDTSTGDYKFVYKKGGAISRETIEKRYGEKAGRQLRFGVDYNANGGLTEKGVKILNRLEEERTKKAKEQKDKRIAIKEEEVKKVADLQEKEIQKEQKSIKETGVNSYQKQHKEPTQKTPRAKGSSSSDAEREAQEEAKRNAKEKADALKHSEEMAALEQKAARARQDASIAAIRDSSERERQERETKHKRELEDLQSQRDEIYKKIYEQRKSDYESKNSGKHYETDDEMGSLGYLDTKAREAMVKSFSDEERKMYDLNKEYYDAKEREKTEINAREEALRLKRQAQSMRDYLKEYGTYQQKKLALAEEYAEKIADAENAGNQGEALRLKAERDSQIAKANAQSLAMNIDWNQTFSGLGNVLEDIAKETLEKVNKYMETSDFKGLNADAKLAYQELKQQLVAAGGQEASNPFGKSTWDEITRLTEQYKGHVRTLADISTTHAKATKEYAKAMADEQAARKKLDKALEEQAANVGSADSEKYDKAVDEAKMDVAAASLRVKEAFDQMTESGEAVKKQEQNVSSTQQALHQKTESAAQGLNNFKTVLGQITSGTLSGFADGVANIIAMLTETDDDDMEGIVGLFGEAGKQIGGIVGAILSIIDMLGTDPAQFIQDILNKVADVIQAIIENIPQIIGAVIQGIGNIIAGVFKGLGGLFGLDVEGRSNHEEMLKRQEEYTHSIDSSSRALNKFTSELERSYGILAMQNAKNAEDIIRRNMESIVNGIDSVLSDNYGEGHSDYYHVNKQQDVLRGILGYGSQYGMSSGSIGSWQDLLTMNSSEVLAKTFKAISESGDDLWRRITTMGYNEGALEEWINKLIDEYDKIEENDKKLKEQLTTTTADNVYDDFLDSLYDLADGSKDVTNDIAENWQKMVNRMVVNNLIGGKMREELEAWYEELANLQDDRINERIQDYSYEVSLKELQDKYSKIVESAKQQIDQFTEDGIIKPIEDAASEVKEYFESLRDSWLDTLTDMEADGKAWKQELLSTIFEDLVESTILNVPLTVNGQTFDDFDTYLKDWTKRYKDVIEDSNLTDEERNARLKELLDEQTDMREEQAEKSKAIAAGIGYDVVAEISNSLDTLRDTFVDYLLDMDADADKLGKQIGATLIREMLEQMLASGAYAERMDEIKSNWQKALNGEDGYTYESVMGQIAELNNDIANDDAIGTLAAQWKALNKEVENSDNLFGNMRSSLVSSMMDMKKSADDISQDIGRTIAQNIIEEMVVTSAVKPLIDDLQKAFDTAMAVEGATYSSVMGDEGVQSAMDKIKDAFPELQATAKEIMAGLGVSFKEEMEGFSNLSDTLVNTLKSAESDVETLGRNLAQSMMEQMLKTIVDDRYKQQMDDLNEEWALALKAGDADQIDAVRAKVEQLYQTIANDDAVKKLADDIKALGDETGTPFDSLRSSFLSALTSMTKSTKEFTKEISTMIAESFVDSFVLGEQFDEKLAEWKRKYKAITTDSSMSEEERMRQLRELSAAISQERTDMQAEVTDIYKMLGIKDTQDQSATMNMAEAATYDQFELYLGMETSHLMVAEETKGIAQKILDSLNGMKNATNPANSYGEQIFMRLGTTNEYLLAMKKAVEGIYSDFGGKIDRMNALIAKWG